MNSAERINKIASQLNLNSYLEIGVQRGITFNAINNIPYKTAVDPNFKFNYKNHESDSTKFFEITSDVFFKNNKSKFDLIFLDGLHEFKQTYRDFVNALEFSNEKSIIIIDDVFPNDVYSSLTGPNVSSNYCYFLRQSFHPENRDGRWHGDVFKTIAFIHDFYPNITLQTISNQYGNPQTICYRKPRENFQPKFNSFEAIERLSFFDMIQNMEFFSFTAEEDALNNVVSFVKSF